MIRPHDAVVRYGRALFGCLAAVGPLGCSTDAGGPSFLTLGADFAPGPVQLGAPTAPSERIAELCARMPVLLGSNVDKKATSASGPTVTLRATRDLATVSFPNATNEGTTRSYSLGELTVGVSDTVVLSVDGEMFEATIETGCTNP